MISLSLMLAIGCGGGSDTDETATMDTSPPVERLTILHSNDWQSHMLGWGPNGEYSPDTTGDDTTVGGLARIKAKIDEIRDAADHPVVLYDAGDWMAGALFQLLAKSDAAELQMMQELGYDAITIGNHEYDWGPALLGEMITTANEKGVDLTMVASNTHPDPTNPDDDPLEEHFTSGRIKNTHVQEVGDLRIGLFGLLGDSAQSITPAAAPTTFSPSVEAAQAAMEELASEDVDIVIALTHAGVSENSATSADEILAEAVPGIDVIVGGHSHTPLFEEIQTNGTIIVQAGAYTRYLGELTVTRAEGGDWELESYQLHEMNDEILGDANVTSMVDGFLDTLEAGPLADLGYNFDTPIISVEGDVAVDHCTESGLGNYVTDAFRTQLSALSPDDPIDVAFESQGVIRDNISAGQSGIQGFSDIFRVMPLGVGTDDVPGYSLVHFWVTAQELAGACEVTASISPDYGCDYFIEFSGMRCTVDMGKSLFNRVVKLELPDGDGWREIDTSRHNDELFHIAVDSYVASLMNILEGLTFGGISVTPKRADGTPTESSLEWIFDTDPETEGIQEMKLWEALIGYGESFADIDGDGVSDLPGYLEGEERLVGFD